MPCAIAAIAVLGCLRPDRGALRVGAPHWCCCAGFWLAALPGSSPCSCCRGSIGWSARAGRDAGLGRAARADDRCWMPIIAGLPDPTIALDGEGRVAAFNPPASSIAPALRRGELVSLALRVPQVVEAIRRVIGERQARERAIRRARAGRPLVGGALTPMSLATARPGSAALLLLTFHDLTPDPAGRGNARRFRRQCQPRIAHAAGGACRASSRR